MERPPLAVAAALAQAAASINQSRTLQETLDAIVEATRTSLPAFDHVSISVRRRDGSIETVSGTDELVWELDALQYQLREGPCVDAAESEPVVVVPHLRHEQRWPHYTPVALRKGVRSQVGVQLFSSGRHLGGLNLYCTTEDGIDGGTAEMARLFATHAGIVLGHAEEEHHLNAALTHRKTIGQAIGIVMERYQIDEDRSLQFLMRASSTSNIKLRDVAAEVVSTTNDSYRRTV